LTEEDVQLVQAAQAGDRGAFGLLVERFKGRVFAAAMAIALDREEALDLTQETFARALQNLPRLQEPSKFQPWLRGITHTVSQDLRRKAARERRHMQRAAHQRPVSVGDAHDAIASREAGEKELAVLSELVAALPENCRVALDLRFREGLSYAEIGNVMGVPASTVRGLLYRGTRDLRLKLRPKLKKTRGE
jgi:RNA polymerase sigma-70 factor (ECF subfamily)